MNDDLSCRAEDRRERVRGAELLGLDFVEVCGDQRTLYVYCLGKAPQKIDKKNLRLTGGKRICDVEITSLHLQRKNDPTLDDVLEVRVNKPGDFSTYILSAVELDERGNPSNDPMAGFDPRYASVKFTFKAGCPSDLDCKQPLACPPPERKQPEVNYLAKDYESFRQLILDRLALIMPAWKETHAPDLGIALVELLAYTGDYLSYYQDAVATEAYLGTARRRISVRRHARLVDYAMHEGCNSRAWLTFQTDTDQQLDLVQTYFVTAFPTAGGDHVVNRSVLSGLPKSSYEVFEPLWPSGSSPFSLWTANSEIHFYTWGDCECCLPKGATSATLVDAWVSPADSGGSDGQPGSVPAETVPVRESNTRAAGPNATSHSDDPPGSVRALHLRASDVLIFEEVLGPKTGSPADADPTHRQAVRLTKVTPGVDTLYPKSQHPNFGQPILEIEWCPEDALKFPLCISSREPYPDCSCMENVSVARGNVLLVDYGATTDEKLGTVPTDSTTPRCACECEPSQVEIVPGQFRPKLSGVPLTFSQPLSPPCCGLDLHCQDPRQALPSITLVSIPPGVCECIIGVPKPTQEGSETVNTPPMPSCPCQVPSLFTFADLDDPTSLLKKLAKRGDLQAELLFGQLSANTRLLLSDFDPSKPPDPVLVTALLGDLNALLETWVAKADLLESGPDDNNFVVEMDDEGYAHIRFGEGALGRQPAAGMAFRAHYRVGNGVAGNVGAETIAYMIMRQGTLSGSGIMPRNPLAARGGTDPEPVAEVKLLAPHTFRSVLERAITTDDYAAIAEDNDRRWKARAQMATANPEVCTAPFRKLQQAKAALRWTGSWYTVLLALDPTGTECAGKELVGEITAFLRPYERMGYDLRVAPAQYVPLSVTVNVCVLTDYLQGHVEAAVLDALSTRSLPNGQLGFFHPDNLTFGEGIFVSKLVAAVQAVPGVQDVSVTELERFEISEPPLDKDMPGEELPPGSVLKMGPLEIARLDNDPNFPENGRLVVHMRGGR